MARAQTPGPRRPKTREQIAARDASAEAAEVDRMEKAIVRRAQAMIEKIQRRAIPIKEAARRLGVSIDTLERSAPPPSLLMPIAKPGKRAVRRCDESEVEAMIVSKVAHAAWVRCKNAREAAWAIIADEGEAASTPEHEVKAARTSRDDLNAARQH